MLTVKTTLDRIVIDQDGSVSVRFLKQACNADSVLFSEPHRVLIPADGDVAATMGAINAHLEQMGFPAASAADALKIKSYFDLTASMQG